MIDNEAKCSQNVELYRNLWIINLQWLASNFYRSCEALFHETWKLTVFIYLWCGWTYDWLKAVNLDFIFIILLLILDLSYKQKKLCFQPL